LVRTTVLSAIDPGDAYFAKALSPLIVDGYLGVAGVALMVLGQNDGCTTQYLTERALHHFALCESNAGEIRAFDADVFTANGWYESMANRAYRRPRPGSVSRVVNDTPRLSVPLYRLCQSVTFDKPFVIGSIAVGTVQNCILHRNPSLLEEIFGYYNAAPATSARGWLSSFLAGHDEAYSKDRLPLWWIIDYYAYARASNRLWSTDRLEGRVHMMKTLELSASEAVQLDLKSSEWDPFWQGKRPLLYLLDIFATGHTESLESASILNRWDEWLERLAREWLRVLTFEQRRRRCTEFRLLCSQFSHVSRNPKPDLVTSLNAVLQDDFDTCFVRINDAEGEESPVKKLKPNGLSVD